MVVSIKFDILKMLNIFPAKTVFLLKPKRSTFVARNWGHAEIRGHVTDFKTNRYTSPISAYPLYFWYVSLDFKLVHELSMLNQLTC
jgi:hypothetical protein